MVRFFAKEDGQEESIINLNVIPPPLEIATCIFEEAFHKLSSGQKIPLHGLFLKISIRIGIQQPTSIN